MSEEKPSTEERQCLLREALDCLPEHQQEKVFEFTDTLFESILTEEDLLHKDAGNPITHHTEVLKHMMRIARGESYPFKKIRKCAALSLLHDIKAVPKITREEREAAKSPEEKSKLELKNLNNRIVHMSAGSVKAEQRLRDLNSRFSTPVFTDKEICDICIVIAIHDIPSIRLKIPNHSKLAMDFREADRLWMQTREGVKADLKRKGNECPTEMECVNQANKNLESYRKERELYGSDPALLEYIFRTKTGLEIFKSLRSQWEN